MYVDHHIGFRLHHELNTSLLSSDLALMTLDELIFSLKSYVRKKLLRGAKFIFVKKNVKMLLNLI